MTSDLRNLSDAELELLPTEILDRAAFGFTTDDVIDVPLAKIHIRYVADIENAEREVRTSAEAKRVLQNAPPVDVTLRDGRFDLEDGHHRFVAARILRRKTLRAKMSLSDNPIKALRLQRLVAV